MVMGKYYTQIMHLHGWFMYWNKNCFKTGVQIGIDVCYKKQENQEHSGKQL